MRDLGDEYEEYLSRWADRFGGSREGQVAYTYREQKIEVPVFRLSRGEFAIAFSAVDDIRQRYEQAEQKDDVSGMRQALSDSFPYELMLLLR